MRFGFVAILAYSASLAACEAAESLEQMVEPSVMVQGPADTSRTCMALPEIRELVRDLGKTWRYTDARFLRPDGNFEMQTKTLEGHGRMIGNLEHLARANGCTYDAAVLALYEREDYAAIIGRLRQSKLPEE